MSTEGYCEHESSAHQPFRHRDGLLQTLRGERGVNGGNDRYNLACSSLGLPPLSNSVAALVTVIKCVGKFQSIQDGRRLDAMHEDGDRLHFAHARCGERSFTELGA